MVGRNNNNNYYSLSSFIYYHISTCRDSFIKFIIILSFAFQKVLDIREFDAAKCETKQTKKVKHWALNIFL